MILLQISAAQGPDEDRLGEQRAERRMFHHQIVRGSPVRVFKGEGFTPVA